jgi:hypothetical protein
VTLEHEGKHPMLDIEWWQLLEDAYHIFDISTTSPAGHFGHEVTNDLNANKSNALHVSKLI